MFRSCAKLTHSLSNFAKFVKNIMNKRKNNEIAEIMSQLCARSRRAAIAFLKLQSLNNSSKKQYRFYKHYFLNDE